MEARDMTEAGFAPHPPLTINEAALQASAPAVAHAIAANLVRTYGNHADAIAQRIRAEIAEMKGLDT